MDRVKAEMAQVKCGTQFGGRKGVASMVAVSRRSQSDLEREQTGMKQFYLNRIDGGESSA